MVFHGHGHCPATIVLQSAFRIHRVELRKGWLIVRRFVSAFFMVLVCLVSGTASAQGVARVPDGNRHAEQPAIPGASVRRTKAGKTTFDLKYEKVRDLLASDAKLMSKIKSTARAYGIDPIHIVGALVGEHT